MHRRQRNPLLVAAVVVLAGCGSAAASESQAPPVAAPSPPVVVPPVSPVPETVAISASPTPESTVAAAAPSGPSTSDAGGNVARPLNSLEPVDPNLLVDANGVLLVGDSVMEAAGPEYYDTIDPALERLGWEPNVRALYGRNTSQAIDIVKQEAKKNRLPDVVVVLIGHNDSPNAENYRARLDDLMKILAGTPRVVFLTIREFKDSYAALNAVLRSLPARYPNVEIVEWDAAVTAEPGALTGDRLHLSRGGAALLASTIAAQLGPSPLLPAIG